MIDCCRLQWQRLTHDKPDLSSERVPQKDKTVTLKKKSLVKSPRLCSTPRHTDWLTVSSNVTLTLTWPMSRSEFGLALLPDRIMNTGNRYILDSRSTQEERIDLCVESEACWKLTSWNFGIYTDAWVKCERLTQVKVKVPKSHYDRRSVSQYILVSSPICDFWPYIFFSKVTVLSFWGALSDERSCLSFVCLCHWSL
jgi:hypothetical protein